MDHRIERLQRRAADRFDGLSLAGGLPLAALFPRRALAEAFRLATRDPNGAALQYAWPEGTAVLRAWVAGRLAARGADIGPDDVIITSGAQQALATIAEVLDLSRQSVGVDAETYSGALDLFRRRGARCTTSADAGVFYAVPGASNPRGLGMSPERRRLLLDSGRPLIADEAYAELRYDGALERPLIADAKDRVFHVGTLSKTLCPGLRLGWVVAPERYRRRVLEAKRDADLQAPSLTQALMDELVRRFDWDAHLARARQRYARRVEVLIDAVRRHLGGFSFLEPEGGFTLFVSADDPALEEVSVLAAATRLGTSFDPGSMFRADGSKSPFAMRLCPCNVRIAEIDPAVRRLARAIALVRDEAPAAGRYTNRSGSSDSPGVTA